MTIGNYYDSWRYVLSYGEEDHMVKNILKQN